MTRRFVAVLCLLAVPVILFAEWPANLQWQGVPLGYPKIAPDGHNGAFVAGSGLAFDGWDTFLFHVDSLGNSLWEESDSACYIGPGNQYPLTLYADGTGGCVMLMDDELTNFPNPSRHRVQIIRYNAEGHRVWSFVPYDTTSEDLHLHGVTAVTHGQVNIFWYNSLPDSVGDWMTRLRVEDGTAIDSPAVTRLGHIQIRQSFEHQDSLYLLSYDSIFVMGLHSGEISLYRPFEWLTQAKLFMIGDTVLIAGSSGGSCVIKALYGENMTRMDTISGVGSVLLNSFPNDYRIFVSYGQNANYYGRFYSPSAGLGDEVIICDAPENQFNLKVVSGNTGLGFSWMDRPAGFRPRLFIQQLRQNQFRWDDGLLISDSVDMADMSGGNAFGLLAYVWAGLIVQPVDSLPTSPITRDYPDLPQRFTLYPPYPNPFNGSVQVQFELERTSRITLSLYNVLGQKVAILADERFSAGIHTLNYENDLASGVYLLCLSRDGKTQIKKLISIK